MQLKSNNQPTYFSTILVNCLQNQLPPKQEPLPSQPNIIAENW